MVKTDRLELDVDPADAIDALNALPPRSGGPDLLTNSSDAVSEVGLPDIDVPGDELAVVAILAATTCGGIISACYVIYIAPGLLAEVLLDGTLSYGLYRRLRGVDRRHWLESAIRRTWVPAAAVALSFAIAGGAMHWYAPEATSIGEVWQHLVASPR